MHRDHTKFTGKSLAISIKEKSNKVVKSWPSSEKAKKLQASATSTSAQPYFLTGQSNELSCSSRSHGTSAELKHLCCRPQVPHNCLQKATDS